MNPFISLTNTFNVLPKLKKEKKGTIFNLIINQFFENSKNKHKNQRHTTITTLYVSKLNTVDKKQSILHSYFPACNLFYQKEMNERFRKVQF